MRNGVLPDFNQMGEMIYPEDASADETKSAFARYMEDATFLIPTPQVLQKIITGLDDLYEHDLGELNVFTGHNYFILIFLILLASAMAV